MEQYKIMTGRGLVRYDAPSDPACTGAVRDAVELVAARAATMSPESLQ
jgi:hypothetical protein